jgi:ATP-dependent DNA helicase UvrD/PcrA
MSSLFDDSFLADLEPTGEEPPPPDDYPAEQVPGHCQVVWEIAG